MHGGRAAWLLLAAALASPGAAAQGQERAPPAEGVEPAAEGAEPTAEGAQPPENEAGARDAERAEASTSENDAFPRPSGRPAGADVAEADVPYTVECGPDPEEGGNVCLVDRDTYVGWRTFHSVCHTCHAQDAVGSTFAPALLPRVRQIDKARFLDVVDQGFTGQVGVMPGWAANPNVNKYYDELWSYLRARADGVLAPGRPKRLPESR